MFIGQARPLVKPITSEEAQRAIKRLKNRKAVTPDDLPLELLKAAGQEGASFVADVINASFSQHETLGVGEGLLAALQKPGKPKGPLGSLRPIVLLTAIRKVLSLITLDRARAKIEGYLSASQAAFRRGRATSDIIWALRWLTAKATRYKTVIHILGLDMSRAFDTISREKLMEILRCDVGLEDDELRMCQALLADTCLRVRLKGVLSEVFETTIGTPQGDGLSPILFAVYLERALIDVRASMPQRPMTDKGLPEETLYADDADFFSTDYCFLQELKLLIPQIIGVYNLNANKDKWENTTLTEGDDANWRGVKKLGSLSRGCRGH